LAHVKKKKMIVMRNFTKLVSVFGIMLVASASVPTDTYDGIASSELGGIQYEVCQLKLGKTLRDADSQTNLSASEFKGLGLELGTINFTPFYNNATSSIKSADYITMVYGSIPAFAEGWNKWELSGRAAKIVESRSKVGSCYFKFNHAQYKYTDVPVLEANPRRIVQTEWCKAKLEVTDNELKAQHDSCLASNKSDSSIIAWLTILPQLGQSSRKGSFMHFAVYDSIGALMKNQNWLADGGGAASMRAYYKTFVDCEGPSVWDGTIAQRAVA
jgi:hypothetical protein